MVDCARDYIFHIKGWGTAGLNMAIHEARYLYFLSSKFDHRGTEMAWNRRCPHPSSERQAPLSRLRLWSWLSEDRSDVTRPFFTLEQTLITTCGISCGYLRTDNELLVVVGITVTWLDHETSSMQRTPTEFPITEPGKHLLS